MPASAGLLNGHRWAEVLELVLALDEVDEETSASVPGNVAMERPDTWVVGLNLNDKMALGLDNNGVTARRIAEIVSRLAVPDTRAVVENKHIVTI